MARGMPREGFDEFFDRVEPRLRQALCATLGSEPGREATVDALTYAWRRWDKVRAVADPVAYLYVIGRNRGRRRGRAGPVALAVPDDHRLP